MTLTSTSSSKRSTVRLSGAASCGLTLDSEWQRSSRWASIPPTAGRASRGRSATRPWREWPGAADRRSSSTPAIKALRDTGLDRMPFRRFAANQAWLELVLAAADLLAWLRAVALDGELARAEPKTLRYRLLHAAARLVHRGRQVVLRLPAKWPWAVELADAYRRVGLLRS